jgi:hypothetical protein
VNLYDKLLAKDKRTAKEFEYLNAAGAWGQLALAGLEEICDQDFEPTTVEQYAKQLLAIKNWVIGSMEVTRSRMDYMVNLVEHGPAEARMVADLMEERLITTMSVAIKISRRR